MVAFLQESITQSLILITSFTYYNGNDMEKDYEWNGIRILIFLIPAFVLLFLWKYFGNVAKQSNPSQPFNRP